uniref:Equilibrative nucleoside transporter family protein n=1 Tax=Trepomonas sp. PC1 TaxID=1076344 RepID=A0A146K860_9EUKA|eukprot:JAP91766.1 Equilibrative nucleoside transporter family protein [Trepomonas sp. PC1]
MFQICFKTCDHFIMSEEYEQLNSQTTESTAVKSKSTRVYIALLILGIATLIPFNCIIVPVDFWMKYYEQYFLSAASLTHNICNWSFMILMMFKSEKFNMKTIIKSALSIWFVSLVAIPLIYLLPIDKTAKTIITLIPVALCGTSNALFFPTILNIGSKLDPKNAQGIMAGQGIAGLIPQVFQIIIKAIMTSVTNENGLFYQTLVYFIFGAMFIAFCFYPYKVIKDMGLLDKKLLQETDSLLEEDKQKEEETPFFQLFKKMWLPTASIFLIFFITMSSFPAITIHINCITLIHQDLPQSDWWNVGMMSTFILLDFVGRSISGFSWANRYLGLKTLFVIAICRICFTALFLMEALPLFDCQQQPAGIFCTGDGPVIKADVMSIATMFMFALTNGWVSSVIMMKFTSVIEKSADFRNGGNIQSFMLNSGLLCGGCISLAMEQLFK